MRRRNYLEPIPPRGSVISGRVTLEDRRAIEAAAERARVTLSAYVAQAAADRAAVELEREPEPAGA